MTDCVPPDDSDAKHLTVTGRFLRPGEYEKLPTFPVNYQLIATELAEALVDACWRGTGTEPESWPTWEEFISVNAEADALLRRPEVAALLHQSDRPS
jgi:hypothetical protein